MLNHMHRGLLTLTHVSAASAHACEEAGGHPQKGCIKADFDEVDVQTMLRYASVNGPLLL